MYAPRQPRRKGTLWLIAAIVAVLSLVVGIVTSATANSATPHTTSISQHVTLAQHTTIAATHSEVQSVTTNANFQADAATQRKQSPHGTVTQGPGRMTSGYDWVGLQCTNGHCGVCISPTMRLDFGQTWSRIMRLTHTTKQTSLKIEWLLFTYGHQSVSNNTAASLRIAVNHLINGKANKQAVKKWKAQLGQAIYKRGVKSMTSEATRLHAPYKYTLTLDHTLLIHQSSIATTKLTSIASGAGVPGKVSFFHTSKNANVSRSHATSNSKGVATTMVTRTNVGRVHLSAHVHHLASAYMLLSQPDPGQQQLLAAAPGASASYTLSFNKSPARSHSKSVCPNDCTGITDTTTNWCHEAGSEQALLKANDATDKNRVLAQHTFARSSKTQCYTLTYKAPNAHKIVVTLQYQLGGNPKTPTKPVVLETFVIDCGPFFVVDVAQALFCGGCQSVTVKSDVNRATTTVTVTYTDSAGNKATYHVAPGKSVSATTFKVNAPSVNWTVVETVPYATHAGARTQTATGTVKVT